MLKISRKFYSALLAGSFFSINEWHFETKSTMELIKAVQSTQANPVFEIDILNGAFRWEDYVKHFILGVRQYILREQMDTLPSAKIKLKRLVFF